MEHSRDEIALDMIASANSDEFSPELVAISKAQTKVEELEEKTLNYVSHIFYWENQSFYCSFYKMFTVLVFVYSCISNICLIFKQMKFILFKS